MNLSEFDYSLPKNFIAQKPLNQRDNSKLIVLDRKTQSIDHHHFYDLPDLLDSNTVLVFNESRVIPARLLFKIGEINAEILLIKPLSNSKWECVVRPGKKFKEGVEIKVDDELSCHVESITEHGLRVIRFDCEDLNSYLKSHGHTPLPPYIKEEIDNPEKYQTIYSKTEGSVAAPTAGFHFTDEVFKKLKEKGIQTEFVTLHVGLGTFQPVKTDNVLEHKMHSEWFELSPDVADRLNKAKENGKKIVAVGTTSIRVLESCAMPVRNRHACSLQAQSGETDIFIYPGYKWKFIDHLITNFHVPKSTLLMLVSAFADPANVGETSESSLQTGRDFIITAYEEAKKQNYRFFSFGDSMMIK